MGGVQRRAETDSAKTDFKTSLLAIALWSAGDLHQPLERRVPPETDSAHRNKVAITVALLGAKRPKLVKTMTSQKTSTPSNGREMEVLPCSNISQRNFPRSIAILDACAWSAC